MDLVSIIVPVYNEEKHLPRCLDSLLAQTHENIEIILVHDVSPDRSGEICDSYAAVDKRIKVIHRRPDRKGIVRDIGVVSARNAGLAAASGAYIQFADADDYVSPEITATLVKAITEGRVDMAICDAMIVSMQGEKESIIPIMPLPAGKMRAVDFAIMLLERRDYSTIGCIWNKLYLKKVIDSHGICFRDDAMPADDVAFNLDYWRHCRDVVVEPKQYYIYVTGSTVDTISCKDKYFPNLIDVRLMICRELDTLLRDNELEPPYGAMANIIIGSVVNYCRRDATVPQPRIIATLDYLARDPDVRKWFSHYKPQPGQSRLIPFLLKYQYTKLLFWLARYKADKRYGKFYNMRNG